MYSDYFPGQPKKTDTFFNICGHFNIAKIPVAARPPARPPFTTEQRGINLIRKTVFLTTFHQTEVIVKAVVLPAVRVPLQQSASDSSFRLDLRRPTFHSSPSTITSRVLNHLVYCEGLFN
jgi:hypothetical protein